MYEEPRLMLARRLKELREQKWPRCVITQGQLAEALSARRSVSVASISSWESTTTPKPPPVHRLEAYATFFATERSVAGEPYQLLDVRQLTEEERAARGDLLAELTGLRTAATTEPVEASAEGGNLLRFDDGKPITIVCSQLPAELLKGFPYANVDDPDYVRLYTYADPDALLELYGHVRALNPGADVRYRLASELGSADYPAIHLISLGGVDWNALTRDLLRRLRLPLRQELRPEHSESGHFEINEGGEKKNFVPHLQEVDGKTILVDDVAHFYHGPSPFNSALTVTICNGMYGRGTLGAVRALTDPLFSRRNQAYIERRFAGRRSISILSRVSVVNGRPVAPDWTDPKVRLHEWSEEPL
ncbi:helix-turn-helix domain-containing protein [Amycolatopsis sp. NPDC059657]|uniref:helix-turn-helix domain-containing protein n=1 Tax=Amycolatopsis sp. NPDC059657 TaxID=3346899 RepID=UPI00366EBB10